MNIHLHISSHFIRPLLCFITVFYFSQNIYADKKDTTRILFVGNSYTYAGMGEANPELPFRLKEMGNFYSKPVSTDFAAHYRFIGMILSFGKTKNLNQFI